MIGWLEDILRIITIQIQVHCTGYTLGLLVPYNVLYLYPPVLGTQYLYCTTTVQGKLTVQCTVHTSTSKPYSSTSTRTSTVELVYMYRYRFVLYGAYVLLLPSLLSLCLSVCDAVCLLVLYVVRVQYSVILYRGIYLSLIHI